MCPFNGWSERNHVHAGVDRTDEAAFKPSMDGKNLRILVEQVPVRIRTKTENDRIRVGFPSGIPGGLLYFSSCQVFLLIRLNFAGWSSPGSGLP
jgi:hypothetical protein